MLLMVEVSGIEGVRLAVVIGPQHNRLYQIKGDLHYVYPVKYSTIYIYIRPNLVFHALELNNSMVENNYSTIYRARVKYGEISSHNMHGRVADGTWTPPSRVESP